VGVFSRTTSRGRGPIDGAKTVIAGISDDKQRLCSRWRCGTDAIRSEGALFGLTNSEGNHGEDVKEYYFYVDSTPTHSYMKYLYKYPQRRSLSRSRRDEPARSRTDMEYELLDTGVFDEDRYFDVFVEYAKGGPDDVLVRITVHNRGRTQRSCICCRRCGSATRGRGTTTG
jgi:hypothetical protein